MCCRTDDLSSSSPVTSSTDVDHAALRRACALAELSYSSATLLHRHATAVYLLEPLPVVARVSSGQDNRNRARTAVRIAQWLNEQSFPAVAPVDVDQPVEIGEQTVTLWHYYSRHGRPAPGAEYLGELLRGLHQLPDLPPVPLEPYEPLASLGTALASATSLNGDDRKWVQHRRSRLLDAYRGLNSTLGHGLVHGDAYPGNTLWDGKRVVLGDWDEVAYGPRELDLTNTHQGARFGRSTAECERLSTAYGWDVTRWQGYRVLCELRELHTLAVCIRRSDRGDSVAVAELEHRVRTLRTDDTSAGWHTA